MIHFNALTRVKLPLLGLFIMITLAIPAGAQDYWNRIPALTSQCYGENDAFIAEVRQLRSEIKDKLDKSKQAVEEKASKMSNEERMAMVTKYQSMTPDEIVAMQNEMMETTRVQAEFQQKSSAHETRFNELESDFRSEFSKRLGPIEQEYRKLPDGEGTPQWAIVKGEELMALYNKEYESICDKYFTSSTAVFRVWLKEFNTFLLDDEVPFNDRMIKMQYGQFGITADKSVASLMALDRYLEKCAMIFGLRRPYPQG